MSYLNVPNFQTLQYTSCRWCGYPNNVFRAAAVIVLASLTATACSDTPTTPPPPSVPPGTVTINGNERLGWDQRAADPIELATYRYAIFVDGTRSELSQVACESLQAANGFPCSAPLPRLSSGAHRLELATFIVDATTLFESDRSAALQVVVATALTTGVPQRAPSADRLVTSDGVVLGATLVRADLSEPVDLVFAPDGTLFVAESGGSVRVARSPSDPGILTALPGQLLAVALDPAFADNHLVFVLYVAKDANGAATFTIARFRELDGRLSDRVILSDSVPASSEPRGTLRFGLDGRLYVALDDGGVPERADDLASANGKILRLDKDGTTPPDQDGMTPMFVHGLHAPRAIAWATTTRELWAADVSVYGEDMLLVSRATSPRVRGTIRAAYRLPPPTAAAGLAFYSGSGIPQFAGNLFVASDRGEDLLRLRFDPADPGKVLSTERLLRGQIGAMRAIAESPDGALYIATDTGLWRIVFNPD
jgi:glucose/arabinose dehydrogenase